MPTSDRSDGAQWQAATKRRLGIDAAVELGPDDGALGDHQRQLGFDRQTFLECLGVTVLRPLS
ncbi:hypothetical protein [Rhizobium sp. YTU87027]|uniref:hypothetical protein n=1 Tax=Rhizobium sp. YTU87027 TaxID=3417741 RepID=UPI003D685D76